MALVHVGWPRDDYRWYHILQNGMYTSGERSRAAHLEDFGWCSIGRIRI